MAPIPVLLGTAPFGTPENGGRVTTTAAVQELVDLLLQYGHNGIDTAHAYCQGTSQQLVGTVDLRGALRVDTKILAATPGDHSPQRLKELFKICSDALKGKKIRVLYLHAPDRSVPYEDTLEGINEIWKAGGFEEFGMSNFTAWEVAEIVGICKRRGFVPPTVCQGGYNIIERNVEAELLPCLRKFGIKFAAYCPLAGGYLTNSFFVSDDTKDVPLPNYDSEKYPASFFYKARYENPLTTAAVAELLRVVKAHNLTLSEVALRWLQRHSKLQPSDHGIVMAADNKEQLETNLLDCEKGPLPESIIEACDEAWRKAKPASSNYWI